MENKFVVNIIHRPELSPEYAERALGKGEGVRDESLDIFRFQQDMAHQYGLKTTIQITYASLFSPVYHIGVRKTISEEWISAKTTSRSRLLSTREESNDPWC